MQVVKPMYEIALFLFDNVFLRSGVQDVTIRYLKGILQC